MDVLPTKFLSEDCLEERVGYLMTDLVIGTKPGAGGIHEPVNISGRDRAHSYLIGQSGTGKSTALLTMAVQDIRNGSGLTVVDPHGQLIEELLKYIPRRRIEDVVYLNGLDTEFPFGLNLLEVRDGEDKELAVAQLLSVFQHLFSHAWGDRTEYIMHNCIESLLEVPNSTLVDLYLLLVDHTFQQHVAGLVTNPAVRIFWRTFLNYPHRFVSEITAAPLNKVGQLITSTQLRNIIGQKRSTINASKVINRKSIVLANLAKGRLGEQTSNLLGAMLITKLYLAALGQQEIPEAERPAHIVYIDEFPSFVSAEGLPSMLAETRKYNVFATLSHQFLEQIPSHMRQAIFGNVATWLTFRVGLDDAQELERQYYPQVKADSLIRLANYRVVHKHLVEGRSTLPSTAMTLPPPSLQGDEASPETIVKCCRERGAKPRAKVEEVINERLMEVVKFTK